MNQGGESISKITTLVFISIIVIFGFILGYDATHNNKSAFSAFIFSQIFFAATVIFLIIGKIISKNIKWQLFIMPIQSAIIMLLVAFCTILLFGNEHSIILIVEAILYMIARSTILKPDINKENTT